MLLDYEMSKSEYKQTNALINEKLKQYEENLVKKGQEM
jgi:hypothetical protein